MRQCPFVWIINVISQLIQPRSGLNIFDHEQIGRLPRLVGFHAKRVSGRIVIHWMAFQRGSAGYRHGQYGVRIPEPGGIPMLGAGLVSLALLALRRNRAR